MRLQPQRVHQAVGGVVRAADVEDLPLRDEIVERAQDLVLRRVEVLHVDLIEVDVIGAEALQAVLHAAHDAVAGGAGPVGPFAHGEAELGGEDDLLAALIALDPGADDPLAEAVLPVDVRRVDEVHAQLQRAIQDVERRLLVGADLVHERLLVGLAEGHRAQAELRHLDARRSELSVFHDLGSPFEAPGAFRRGSIHAARRAAPKSSALALW